MPASVQTIFIVEDDASVRDSLGLLLGLKGYRTQSFECAEDFLRVYQPSWAGCLLLDIRMPGMNGLELQETLRRQKLSLPVIIMTAHGDLSMVKTALKAGAVDFLEKPVDPDALLIAIQTALNVDATQRVATREIEEARARLSVLTPRERQVMDLVAKGCATREIGETLGISPRTVEVHKARVREKLRVDSIPELVRLTLRASL